MNTTLQIDENGVLTLTDELLEVTGWKEGDELEFIDNNDGSFGMRLTERKENVTINCLNKIVNKT